MANGRKKRRNKKRGFLGIFGYGGYGGRAYERGIVKNKKTRFLNLGSLFKKKNKKKIGGSSNNGNVANKNLTVHSPRVGGYGHQKPANYTYKSWADFGPITPGGNK